MTSQTKILICFLLLACETNAFWGVIFSCSSAIDFSTHLNDDGQECARFGSRPKNSVCFAGSCYQRCSDNGNECPTCTTLVATLNSEDAFPTDISLCITAEQLEKLRPKLTPLYKDLTASNGWQLEIPQPPKRSQSKSNSRGSKSISSPFATKFGGSKVVM